MYHQYSVERIERKAEEILSKYLEGKLIYTPEPMDVDHFAEFYLNATIDFANLSKDGKTLGCTCFNDGILMVWNDERTEEYPIQVEKGYIFIDNRVLDSDVEGRVRFTIIHECSHLILHPRFYYKRPGEENPKINCAIYQIEKWDKCPPMTDDEIREWQANRLGAALIMPSNAVKILMADKLGIKSDKLSKVYVSENFIGEMADFFIVSKSAMRNRLRDLNLIY